MKPILVISEIPAGLEVSWLSINQEGAKFL